MITTFWYLRDNRQSQIVKLVWLDFIVQYNLIRNRQKENSATMIKQINFTHLFALVIR